jgi:putative endonuclease
MSWGCFCSSAVPITHAPRYSRAPLPFPRPLVIPAKAGTHPKKLSITNYKEIYPMQYYVYILASKKYGTLYTGVTSNLVERVYQHKTNYVEGFTKKYRVHSLVYYEIHEDIQEAILREKQIKKWYRNWKINLIEEGNPHWLDLYHEIGE